MNCGMRNAVLLAGIGVLVCVLGATVGAQDWVDLGDEGRSLYVSARMELPPLGELRALDLATAGGLKRVSLGVGTKGRYRLWLYQRTVFGDVCEPGSAVILVVRIRTHSKKPDEASLAVFQAADGIPEAEPGEWMLVSREGASDANLASLIATPASARDRISQVRVGPDWEQIRTGPTLDRTVAEGAPAPDLSAPNPRTNPGSGLMLDLARTGTNPEMIDFSTLPRLPGKHAVITTGTPEWRFRLHEYLAWYKGRYWCIWSHGPVIEDKATQHIRYATSRDGMGWTEHGPVVGPPKPGFGYIARGLWVRDGELLALASLFRAPGYPGKGLSLEAFRWEPGVERWAPAGTVLDDALNNFPPKKLPNGRWLMSRRDHKQDVSMVVGGVSAFNDWEILPFSTYRAEKGKRPEEPYWYVLPDGRSLVGLFRNNVGKSLIRAFSSDSGRTWSPMVITNFPDATSKFFVVHTSSGYYAMVSNANPIGRNPLCLSVSRDGLVYTGMAVLPIPANERESLQYPHAVEHDGQLLVVFSRGKQTVEIVKIPMSAVDALLAPPIHKEDAHNEE